MEKVKYRYNRWRLALGRLVNLRYINRWIIFCADLFISLCVSLIGVLGLLSIMHVYISGISVLKVGIASFVASILSFLNPLAELSQCILDSSNGSIINVI